MSLMNVLGRNNAKYGLAGICNGGGGGTAVIIESLAPMAKGTDKMI